MWAILVATLSSVAIAQTTPDGAAGAAQTGASAPAAEAANPPQRTDAATAGDAGGAAATDAVPGGGAAVAAPVNTEEATGAATDEALPAPPPADSSPGDSSPGDSSPGDSSPDDALAVAPPVDASPQLAGQDAGLAPQAVVARGPTQGRPLVVRRGFFTDTNLGTFFTLGGNDAYSNAQSYVQLGIGYDLFDFLEVGAHVAFGSNAFNCFAGRLGQDGSCRRSDAFTVTFFDASVAYLFKLSDRLYLTPKVVAGWTLLDPEPIEGRTRGVNVGGGIGVEYATAMDHFSVGAELLGRYVLGANIPTFAIFPRVKYTF